MAATAAVVAPAASAAAGASADASMVASDAQARLVGKVIAMEGNIGR